MFGRLIDEAEQIDLVGDLGGLRMGGDLLPPPPVADDAQPQARMAIPQRRKDVDGQLCGTRRPSTTIVGCAVRAAIRPIGVSVPLWITEIASGSTPSPCNSSRVRPDTVTY